MNIVAPNHPERLPMLVQRAADALLAARSSAEVLDARDMANVAYHAAKAMGRMARAKEAHDSLLSQVWRAQADALLIEARAKMRLADEYDAAQARGEVACIGGNRGNQYGSVAKPNAATAADLGLRRDEIHEARQMRDAEAADPGITKRAIDEIIERGEAPTKARLRSAVTKPGRPDNDSRALWLWGRLKDFERMNILTADPDFLLGEMTGPMRADVRRLLPMVREFIEEMELRA